MKATLGFYCFFVLTLYSCKNNDTEHKATSLEGSWSLIHGELNGNETPALERIYFTFSKDSLKTNFTLSEQDETGTFSLSNDKLVQKTAETIEYDVRLLSDSTIEMTTALRGFDFKLILQKNVN